jgi:hypothetical protein
MMRNDQISPELIDKDVIIDADDEVTEMERQDMSVEVLEEAPEATKESDEEYQAMARDMISDKVIYRTIDLSRGAIDEEKRIVRIGVSSETPVERDFGLEVLGHNKEDIDMEFMSSGRAPLLNNHKMDEQIGVVRSFYLDEAQRRTVALVEFGNSALAQEVFEDVRTGIKQNISVGYSINRMVRSKDGE